MCRLYLEIYLLNLKIWDLRILYPCTPTPQPKSCMIRAGTTRTVYAFSCTVQSGCPVHVELTQHVLCNNCSLSRAQCILSSIVKNIILHYIGWTKPLKKSWSSPKLTELILDRINFRAFSCFLHIYSSPNFFQNY